MNSVPSRRTPYDDDYATCAETRAEVIVYPGSLLPYEITRRLQLEPTYSIAAGEERPSKSGGKTIAKTSVWSLSSEGQTGSLDLRRHLDWLLAQLTPQAEGLRRLQEIPGVRMTVNCAWYSKLGHGGPTLWPEQMQLLAELNLECNQDRVERDPKWRRLLIQLGSRCGDLLERSWRVQRMAKR